MGAVVEVQSGGEGTAASVGGPGAPPLGTSPARMSHGTAGRVSSLVTTI